VLIFATLYQLRKQQSKGSSSEILKNQFCSLFIWSIGYLTSGEYYQLREQQSKGGSVRHVSMGGEAGDAEVNRESARARERERERMQQCVCEREVLGGYD